MPIDNPQYDVAISFLSEDQTLAAEIYGKLSEGLKVFFYPRNQEELAGTDGLESTRKPFFDGSRVVVVLYREKWGKTPCTGVEQTAIEESCLKFGWDRLFFIVLNQSDVLPVCPVFLDIDRRLIEIFPQAAEERSDCQSNLDSSELQHRQTSVPHSFEHMRVKWMISVVRLVFITN